MSPFYIGIQHSGVLTLCLSRGCVNTSVCVDRFVVVRYKLFNAQTYRNCRLWRLQIHPPNFGLLSNSSYKNKLRCQRTFSQSQPWRRPFSLATLPSTLKPQRGGNVLLQHDQGPRGNRSQTVPCVQDRKLGLSHPYAWRGSGAMPTFTAGTDACRASMASITRLPGLTDAMMARARST